LSNAIGMGLSTTVVLVMSNAIISLLRNIIPDRVRIPGFIVVVASLVTIVQLLISAYVPSLNASLGIYIPLIVVNCIILGRAEAFASKNGVMASIGDGIGMGFGFTLGISLISIIRELIGSGTIASGIIGKTGLVVIPEDFRIAIFVLAPGAFLVLAILTAIQNKLKLPSATNKKGTSCDGNCMTCIIHKKEVKEDK
ncbi:MAG: electron transport complex subunit RsxE, partial [Lachnospiraceae bacterium]|nr:electron transport complex subunit RsxE [Lachnospiraceae bacterium]